MILNIISALNDDFSKNNFNNVYKVYKEAWFDENTNKCELEFIDSFDFKNGYTLNSLDKSKFTSDEIENIKRLSYYLAKERSSFDWTDKDFLYDYKKRKIFNFIGYRVYDEEYEFDIFRNTLLKSKETYDFILEKLSKTELVELKNDVCDQLNGLRIAYKKAKFKEVIEEIIEEIEAQYKLTKYRSDLDSGMSNDFFSEKEKKSNMYSNIFDKNAFSVRDEMRKKFDVTQKSRTDIKFMFEIMRFDGLIHKTVSQKNYLDWINDTFELDIGKPVYIDFKNDKRRNKIYYEAKSIYNNN